MCSAAKNDLILKSNSKTWNEAILFLYLNIKKNPPDLQILLLEQWSNMRRSNLPHSELAHSYMRGLPTLEQRKISQVYLGHISLCMRVRAERASPEDLQLTGQEGSWLWKNSCQRTQKRGQDSVKSQCTQALCRLCRNSQRHCTVVIKRWEE